MLGVHKWRKDAAKAAVAVFLLKILKAMKWPTSYWSSAVGCFGKEERTLQRSAGLPFVCLHMSRWMLVAVECDGGWDVFI